MSQALPGYVDTGVTKSYTVSALLTLQTSFRVHGSGDLVSHEIRLNDSTIPFNVTPFLWKYQCRLHQDDILQNPGCSNLPPSTIAAENDLYVVDPTNVSWLIQTINYT